MAKYKTPGVFIEEIPKLPPSVRQVETAIPVFIGYTQRKGIEGSPLPETEIDGIRVTEARRITSLVEYETHFGKGIVENITVTIDETYVPGRRQLLKSRLIRAAVNSPSIHTMYYHMQMYFANGGGPCYVISVGDTSAVLISPANLLAGLKMSSRYTEPTLIVFPQAVSIIAAADAYMVYREALSEAARLKDRFVVMDCYADDPETLRADTGIGSVNLKYGAAYYPFLSTSLKYLYSPDTLTVAWKSDRKDYDEFGNVLEQGSQTVTYSSLPAELQSLVNIELDKLRIVLAPGSAVVGIYALTDNTRGVWKAPANVSLNMVTGLTQRITNEVQGRLNVYAIAGKSINLIRSFTGKGFVIWGARTLAGNDNEWRYISVHRFFMMVEESCKNATAGFLTEPNDISTWVKIQAMLENFLTKLWQQGALLGTKPEQAFYVAIGLNKTMTAVDILEGRMIVEMGLAVARPAEFIILRFTQMFKDAVASRIENKQPMAIKNPGISLKRGQANRFKG